MVAALIDAGWRPPAAWPPRRREGEAETAYLHRVAYSYRLHTAAE